MKICLVTTFPPSTGGLSEYGFHIAQELQRNPFLNLTVLADELPEEHVEPEGFSVVRCWSFDDPRSVLRLMKVLRRMKPDVVWFNLLFSTFGRNPLIAFSGLMTPLLARLSGRYTHVTLHHLMDTVELKDVGVRNETLYRFAGAIATRMLLLSNSVSVLMPGYRKILNDKYGRDNVHLRAHGILTRRPEFPDFTRRGNPYHRILAFGKWGTYKRLELMMEAFHLIAQQLPNVKLVVAGGDHPQAHGYIESMKQHYAEDPRIEFRGYIPEEALADLFQSSSVAVMPYSSSTGCSGVAHLACAYGVPIISADLADFRQMAQGEELAMQFYPAGDAAGLAESLLDLLQSPEKQHGMATQNFSAGLRMTMPNVVQKYLRHFEVQQRVQTLKYVSRFRRLPRWIPSKSLLLRLLTRNSMGWRQRSTVLNAPYSSNDGEDAPLLNGYQDGRGQLSRPGTALDGNDVAAGGRTADGIGASSPARGSKEEQHDQYGASDQANHPTTVDFPDDGNAQQTEAEQAAGEKEGASFAVARRSNGSGLDGQNRMSDAPARSDRRWRE
jgi:glycosyltransferase involved in cell wall biosynthesis